MTRVEVYNKIKEYNLQSRIKNIYGFNYTNLSTATLIEAIRDYEIENVVEEPIDRFEALIEVLYEKHILCKKEYEMLMS